MGVRNGSTSSLDGVLDMITMYIGYLVGVMLAWLVGNWYYVAGAIVYVMWVKAVWEECGEDLPGFQGAIIILGSPVFIFVGWAIVAYDKYNVKRGRRIWR